MVWWYFTGATLISTVQTQYSVLGDDMAKKLTERQTENIRTQLASDIRATVDTLNALLKSAQEHKLDVTIYPLGHPSDKIDQYSDLYVSEIAYRDKY